MSDQDKKNQSNPESQIIEGNEKTAPHTEESDTVLDPDRILLSNPVRWTVFLILTLVATVSSFDGGIIPAASERIMKDMKINDTQFGIYGSVDYLGRLFGAIIFLVIINKSSRQWLLTITLIFKAITLVVSLISQNYWINLVGRGVSGFSQVYYTIYLPVWCDQYGPFKARTMMVTITQVGNPLGIVIGFGLCTLLNSEWTWSLTIEGILLLSLGLLILTLPKVYFSNNLILIDGNITGVEKKKSVQQGEGKEVEEQGEEITLWGNLVSIVSKPVFIFTCLSISVVFFEVSAIQYWGANYMENALGLKDKNVVMFIFSLVSITGPTLGVILGGVTGSLVGGYINRSAIFVCAMCHILASIIGIPITLVDSKVYFTLILWGFFFFNGGLIPLETGVLLSSVPNKMRGDALSLSNLIMNLFGNLPCAFVYGLINDIFKETNNRMAMMCTMLYSTIGIIFIIISIIFRLRLPKVLVYDEEKIVEEKEEEKDTERKGSQDSSHKEESKDSCLIPKEEKDPSPKTLYL